MDANLLLGTIGAVGLAAGAWGLVFYQRKNGNGHTPEPAPEPVQVRENPSYEPVLAKLEELPAKIEQGLAPVFGRMANLIQLQIDSQPPAPTWPRELATSLDRMARTMEDILAAQANPRSEILVATAPEQPQLAQLATKLERLTDQLEAFIELPAPPPPELPELEDLVREIRELVDVGRKKATEKPAEPPANSSVKEDPPVALVSPTLAPPAPKQSKPITRAAEPIVLDEYNTITVEEFKVYELRPPEAGVFLANLLNLGPGWLYVRANAEPTIADPKATTLPPGGIDNEIRVAQRLYVLASADGSITVRVAH